MTIAAQVITRPLFTGTAHRIELILWENKATRTRFDMTGKTLKVRFQSIGVAVAEYTVVATDATEGEGYFDLGTSHVNAGACSGQITVDGQARDRFETELIASI